MPMEMNLLPEKQISEMTQQAAVIGCSHNNPSCNHETHPSSEDFYTIDILEELKPDQCLDIRKESIPPNLENKFKLTILEYLPFYAYNQDDLFNKITGSSGQKGFDNIRKGMPKPWQQTP